MPLPGRRQCAALAAAALLASCSDREEPPAPLTRLLFPPDARALVVLSDGAGPPALHAVDAAGALAPVGRVGEGLELPVPLLLDGDRIDHVWNPLVGGLVPISAEAFAAAVVFGDHPRNRPETAYARATALVARDGTVTTLPDTADHPAPGELQADAAGRLYFADLPSPSAPWSGRTLRPVLLDGGGATLDWPISRAGDAVESYAVDAGGNVAYRAEQGAPAATRVAVLRPTLGPVAVWPDPGDLGSFWRGADGKLHVTRTAPGDPATTELLRLDFEPAPAATLIASWTGAPGLLHGEPFALGAASAFVRSGEVVLLTPGAAAPEVHPLGFAHRAVRASERALWFVTEPSPTQPASLVRWEPSAPRPHVAVLLDAHDVEEVAPYGDGAALVGVLRRSDGARLILRVSSDGSSEPVDVGLARPTLVDGLLLP